jgi:Sulfotransferase family
MHSAPLVVFGTPGSGTRVFARLAIAAGYDLGEQTEANDAAALQGFADRWCAEVYSAWRAGRSFDRSELEADLTSALEAHLRVGDPSARWGWKQPRSLYLLPALHAVFPDLLVLHVLRDGRDMAFSAKAVPHLLLAGSYALPSAPDDAPAEVKAAMLWDEPNRLAADFGERWLGPRYLRLSLEQLCADPGGVAALLSSRLGGEPIDIERLDAIVETPGSLGRRRGAEPALLAQVEAAAAAGLRRFGYLAER